MIKKIIKVLLTILLILIIAVIYLSIFGVKTEKFNNQITKNILKTNKKININLKEVSYLLNLNNFTIIVKTENPKISLESRSLEIKNIKTNISLKSLINDQFLVNDLQIITKEIELSNIIAIIRTFKNSPELLVLDTIIKGGLITANINLNFDKRGKIKKNYKIKGFVKKAKFNLLNKYKLQNLNFDYDIDKNSYSLKKIDTKFNDIKIISPFIEIENKKDSIFVNGLVSSGKKIFETDEFKPIFSNLLNNIDIRKIEFSSKNNFSFNLNKKLKFNNLEVDTVIDLNQLILNEKNLKLKSYFPNFVNEIKLENHKIVINYSKNKFDIKGSGNILLEDVLDNLSYQIIEDDNNLSFDSKINLKNNSLSIDFLDYKKEKNRSSLVSIKGKIKKNDKIRFDSISLKEKDNEILIKGLDLSENFKIIDIQNLNINYKNNKKNLNKLNLYKKDSNFILEGESFDATRVIAKIIDADKISSSIFHNLNSKIKIKIKKTYIDDVNYINNLNGNINFNNNKIDVLKLESTFPNEKKINLSIKTNSLSETITKLSTSYPKPLIKRYNFIKGFEEGYLDFYSSKKNGKSNSMLIIDNFKIKEVPVFAKLLSLASLQGMADLLTGEGIRFTDFEMNFSNKNGLMTIEEMYAIGPAVSIIMDGYIETKRLVSLRGTLVPATTINRTIASIPVLGKILVGGKTGEGVFGVSFKIKGAPKNLKTTVNPVKTLTPRFITRTLEKIKKN